MKDQIEFAESILFTLPASGILLTINPLLGIGVYLTQVPSLLILIYNWYKDENRPKVS